MVSYIAADEGAFVEAQAVGIAESGFQGYLLQGFGGFGIAFGQAWHMISVRGQPLWRIYRALSLVLAAASA
jgi:hypothetical protein